MLKSLSKVIPFLGLLFVFVSCGSDSIGVDDIEVSATQEENDVILNVAADLNIGALSLTNLSLPIILPKVGTEVGTVSLVSDGAGTNQIVVRMNVSEAANLDLETVTLPNGMTVPLIASNSVLNIELNNGVQILLSLTSGAQAIAVVVPISTFDSVGASTGTAALIPNFSIDDISGAAGLFLSATEGQNGIVLAVDLSSVLGDIGIATTSEKSLLGGSEASLDWTELTPSSRQRSKINRALYKLNRKSAVLEVSEE